MGGLCFWGGREGVSSTGARTLEHNLLMMVVFGGRPAHAT